MQHETSVRVKAPIAEVWSEIAQIDQILKRAPGIVGQPVAAPDGTFSAKARLAWGPLTRMLDVAAGIETCDPQHRLVWRMEVPAIETTAVLQFDLASVADDETRLDYRGALTCCHRLVSKMRGMLNDQIEDHVDSVAGRVATLAAQHWQSKQRLQLRAGPGV